MARYRTLEVGTKVIVRKGTNSEYKGEVYVDRVNDNTVLIKQSEGVYRLEWKYNVEIMEANK